MVERVLPLMRKNHRHRVVRHLDHVFIDRYRSRQAGVPSEGRAKIPYPYLRLGGHQNFIYSLQLRDSLPKLPEDHQTRINGPWLLSQFFRQFLLRCGTRDYGAKTEIARPRNPGRGGLKYIGIDSGCAAISAITVPRLASLPENALEWHAFTEQRSDKGSGYQRNHQRDYTRDYEERQPCRKAPPVPHARLPLSVRTVSRSIDSTVARLPVTPRFPADAPRP